MALKMKSKSDSIVMATTSVVEEAKKLTARGFAVTPIVCKTKKAKIKNWPTTKIVASMISAKFFATDNLGIVLGEMSNGLVDVDIDHEIVKCFAEWLPSTEMIHGRAGNSVSHYWYEVKEVPPSEKLLTVDGEPLVELRSNGQMTMVPPSVHPDGDQLAWVKEGKPAATSASVLVTLVKKIAAAGQLALAWPHQGNRNDAAMALSGCLLRAGWDAQGTEQFIYLVAKAANDDEFAARAKCAAATAAKLKAGKEVTGLPRLATIFGNGVAAKVAKWLCIDNGSIACDAVDDVVCELNQKHAVVSIGGSTRILNETIDPSTTFQCVTFSKPSDFRLRYQNRMILNGAGKSVAISDTWLVHPRRRQYEGIEFAPENPTPSHYNLFRGFAIAPNAGDCSKYLSHIKGNICNGDDEIYTFVLSWMAHAIQRPGELPGTALVLRGAQGVGKNVFVDNFGKLFGQHFLALYSLDQVTGKFNSHLGNVLLVHANEAIWGGHKGAEGALKGMVTDPTMPIEAKGKDIIQVRNFKRLIISSNEQWAVPLDLDDRRYLVLDVSPAHKEDHKYFAAIEAQMKDGGLQALMHELKTRDLTSFNIRKLPFSSNALDIKLKSANETTNWWFEQLCSEGALCGSHPKSIVHDHYRQWCSTNKRIHVANEAQFAKELKKLVPSLKSEKPTIKLTGFSASHKRLPCFIFPTQGESRKLFQNATKSGPEIWKD